MSMYVLRQPLAQQEQWEATVGILQSFSSACWHHATRKIAFLNIKLDMLCLAIICNVTSWCVLNLWQILMWFCFGKSALSVMWFWLSWSLVSRSRTFVFYPWPKLFMWAQLWDRNNFGPCVSVDPSKILRKHAHRLLEKAEKTGQ